MHCVDKPSSMEEILLYNIIDDGFKLVTPRKWRIWINSKYESALNIALFDATDPKASVRYSPSRRQCPELTFATPDATFFEFERL